MIRGLGSGRVQIISRWVGKSRRQCEGICFFGVGRFLGLRRQSIFYNLVFLQSGQLGECWFVKVGVSCIFLFQLYFCLNQLIFILFEQRGDRKIYNEYKEDRGKNLMYKKFCLFDYLLIIFKEKETQVYRSGFDVFFWVYLKWYFIGISVGGEIFFFVQSFFSYFYLSALILLFLFLFQTGDICVRKIDYFRLYFYQIFFFWFYVGL